MPIKSITVDSSNIPTEYEPIKITDSNTARVASINLLFSHVADFHKIIVKIIAEKYKINEEEIYETIVNHPDYTNMAVNPVIYGLSYIEQKDVDKAGVVTEGCAKELKNEVIEPPVKVKAIRKKKIEPVIKDEPDIAIPEKDTPPQKIKVDRKKKAEA